MSFYGRRKPTVEEVLEKSKNIRNNDEVEKFYDKIDHWNFPIFDVWENGNVLRGVSIWTLHLTDVYSISLNFTNVYSF